MNLDKIKKRLTLNFFKKVSIITLNILLILVFIFPITEDFAPWKMNNGREGWVESYLYQDIPYLLEDVRYLTLILFFIIVWFLILTTSNWIAKLVLKVLELLLTVYLLFICLMSGMAQDTLPDIGIGILFLICCNFIFYFTVDEIIYPKLRKLIQDF